METPRRAVPAMRLDLAATMPIKRPPELHVPCFSVRGTPKRNYSTKKMSDSLPRAPARPSTARGSPRRFNPAQMTQQICPEIQKLSIEFASLRTVTRRFFSDNSVITLRPHLPALQTELTLAYDTFCRQCTLTFGNTNRSPPLSASRKGTPMYDYGRSLTTKWVEFIEQVNDLADCDVLPYKSSITEKFETFRNCIKRVTLSIQRTQLFWKRIVAVLDKLQQEADACEQSINTVFTAVKMPSFLRLSTEAQEEEMSQLLAKTQALWDKTIPKDGLPIRDRARTSAIMVNSCAAIIETLRSMSVFHSQIADIKSQVVITNNELNKIHERLHLPFAVTLTFGDIVTE